jgi:membrane protease YdiL (CAAX protease family)
MKEPGFSEVPAKVTTATAPDSAAGAKAAVQMPRHKIAIAAASFVIGMLILIFVGRPLKLHLGMEGSVLVQLIILTFALVSTLIARLDLRQVFRIRRSSGTEWLGSFLIYLSAFFGSLAVSHLLATLLPGMMAQGAESQGSFILSGGVVLALVVVGVLPAICEEAWHRGYLLSSLGSIRSVAARVIIIGIVFGLFHLDPPRFFTTMICGCAWGFLRIKTDNMLIPMTFHCLNNLFAVSLIFLADSASEQTAEAAIEASAATPDLGSHLLFFLGFGVLSVLFLVLGRHVFKRFDARRASAPLLAPVATAPAE